MVSVASCHKLYSLLVLYHVSSFFYDMIVVVVATESWIALELILIFIDIGVVVELTGPLKLLVLYRDMSHGSVLFQIQALSGCVVSKFSTLVAGQIWCSVNLDMLEQKNMFLLLGAGQIFCSVNLDMLNEWVHTSRNYLMNLRNPPAITSYSGDWLKVISSLVVSSHWFKMSSIMDFLSAMSLSLSWDLKNDPSLRSEWCGTWGFVLEMGVTSTILELIGLLPDGTSSPMIGLTTPSYT